MTNRRKRISEERYKKLVAMGNKAYGAMLYEKSFSKISTGDLIDFLINCFFW